jgi:aquaporin Z
MNNSQKYVAELVGTLVVVFVGTAAIITTGGNPLVSALAFGLAWAGMWWVFGHVSGGHFNPAITFASLVAKRTDSKDVVPYVAMQAIGGILGAALVWFVLQGAPPAMAATPLASGLANVTLGGWTMVSILVLELLATAFLALVWLAATEKTGASGITGLGVGLAYAAMVLPSLAITWSALNPVRTLGPALLANGGFATLWVFWVAPLVGGIVGAAIWTAVVVPARSTARTPSTTEA